MPTFDKETGHSCRLIEPLADSGWRNVHAEQSVPVEMRDGTVLRADVYRPEGPGRWPVLLRRTPYDKSRLTMGDPYYLASQGFVVAIQDVRGRYASEGVWHSMFQDDTNTRDAEDGFDTIVWASHLPKSTGEVIAFGHSYDAWCAYQAGTLSPPGLVGIFGGGMTLRSRDFNFGLFETGRRMEWTAVMAIDALRRAGSSVSATNEDVIDAIRKVDRYKWLWFTAVADLPNSSFGPLTDDLKALFRDSHQEFFHLIKPRLGAVPTMHVTGVWDRFSRAVDNRGLLSQVGPVHNHKAIFGPWGHHPVNFQFDALPHGYQTPALIRGEDLVVSWAHEVLDGGLGQGPSILYFPLGAGEWRGAETWPPESKDRTYYLASTHGDGVLTSDWQGGARSSAFIYDPRDPNMYLGGVDFQDGPVDLRLHSRHPSTVSFVSPELDTYLEIAGTPILDLWATTTATDTDWAAVLVHCLAEGPEILVSVGIVRARFRDETQTAQLLSPGEPYEYRIRFRPTALLLKPGDRIRIDLGSSYFPGFARNHNTGDDPLTDRNFVTATQAVLHDPEFPSRLILPVTVS
jgi:putative CocE/NonD family hydrolase